MPRTRYAVRNSTVCMKAAFETGSAPWEFQPLGSPCSSHARSMARRSSSGRSCLGARIAILRAGRQGDSCGVVRTSGFARAYVAVTVSAADNRPSTELSASTPGPATTASTRPGIRSLPAALHGVGGQIREPLAPPSPAPDRRTRTRRRFQFRSGLPAPSDSRSTLGSHRPCSTRAGPSRTTCRPVHQCPGCGTATAARHPPEQAGMQRPATAPSSAGASRPLHGVPILRRARCG